MRWDQHQEVGVIEGERGALDNVAYVSRIWAFKK